MQQRSIYCTCIHVWRFCTNCNDEDGHLSSYHYSSWSTFKTFLDNKIQLEEGQRLWRVARGRFLWEGLEGTSYPFPEWPGHSWDYTCLAKNVVIWLRVQGKGEMNSDEYIISSVEGEAFYYIISDYCLSLEQWLTLFCVRIITKVTWKSAHDMFFALILWVFWL